MSHNPPEPPAPEGVLDSPESLELFLLRELIEKPRTAASVAKELYSLINPPVNFTIDPEWALRRAKDGLTNISEGPQHKTSAETAAETFGSVGNPAENTTHIPITVPVKNCSWIELKPGMAISYGWADRGQSIQLTLDGKTIEEWKDAALKQAADAGYWCARALNVQIPSRY